jgi:hypothetical protein
MSTGGSNTSPLRFPLAAIATEAFTDFHPQAQRVSETNGSTTFSLKGNKRLQILPRTKENNLFVKHYIDQL